jgi:hypothetical protein
MDKESFQNTLNLEHDSLFSKIDIFRSLLPHASRDQSIHSVEEGRFIELLISEYLKEKLPKGIGVGSGFIVDLETEWNSRQIDIILYDKDRFPTFLTYGDAIVIPTNALVGAISIKRTLYQAQITHEIQSLSEIGARCGGSGYPKPYLSILALNDDVSDFEKSKESTGEKLTNFYRPRKKPASDTEHLFSWNELIDSIIIFDKYLIKGTTFRPEDNKDKSSSKYRFTGENNSNRNVYIQHLLHGIHRAWYDERRGNRNEKGLTAIPNSGMGKATKIQISGIDRKYVWSNFTKRGVIFEDHPYK